MCTNIVGGYECECNSGYEGDGAEGDCLNIDECADGSEECPANSNCLDTDGSYSCPCVYGYTAAGAVCENIDECSLGNDCDQNCVDGIGAYTCTCDANFALNVDDRISCDPDNACTTQEAIDNCDQGNNRSTCAKDTAGEILCYCPQGYVLNSAKDCEDIDECSTGDNLCSAATSNCINTEPSYNCSCKTGYETSADGVTCQDIDECLSGGDGDDCDQGCVNTAGSFVCTCEDGYSLDSDDVTCVDNDECESAVNNNCDPQYGECTNQEKSSSYPLGYTCGCETGYELSANGFSCIDLNECNAADRGNCAQGCSNNVGSYTCFCGNGYTLNSDDLACDDIDECASSNTHNCYSDGHCTNDVGGYTCTCPTGFVLKSDGFTCESIDKCADNNNCSYTCSVINGTDTCQCARGYGLDTNELDCVDLDECTLGTDVCESADNVVCVNDEPSYHCECVSAYYTQVEAAKCIDVDECADGSAVCGDNSYCSNKVDGYDCLCDFGYADDGFGTCVDVNECNGNNSCNAVLGMCINTEGAYSCECMEGYAGDGIACADVNECNGDNDCDARAERGICTNFVGGYNCSCQDGYDLTSSGICNDINECNDVDTYKINCTQLCINTAGSYKCGCQTGYQLGADGITCTAQVSCSNTTVCDDGCVRIDGKDTCTCNPGYQLDSDNSTCIDLDECATNSSTCDLARGVCTNTEGSFTCACTGGYTLGPNNECDDRDGGVSEWGDYSNCTEVCGTDGLQTRTRTCTNPTAEGNGATCSEELTQSSSCNVLLCQEQLDYGISMQLIGVTAEQFDSAASAFTLTAADAVNDHCTTNSSVAMGCCSTNTTLADPAGLTFLAASSLDVSYLDLDSETVGINLYLLVKFDEQNEVCDNEAAVSNSSRRRRAADINFDQSILLDILDDPAILSSVESAVETALTSAGYTVDIATIQAPAVPAQLTTAGPTTLTAPVTTQGATASGTTEAVTAAPGVASWIIAVAVVSALVVVAIVVVVVVLLIKRPRKVGNTDGDNAEGNNGAAQAENNA